MPTSDILFSVLATLSWSIGPLTIRGDDIYAVVGLVAGVALLTLWVVLEHLRQTRRLRDQPNDSSLMAEPDPLLEPEAPADPARKGTPPVTPVPARTEWLLDDNTLVRTQAVRRGSPIPPASSPPPKTSNGPPSAGSTPSERPKNPVKAPRQEPTASGDGDDGPK